MQKNVLLIEDDPYWQFIVTESIRSFANEVNIRCVRTAQQAEKILFCDETKASYDLIISDHHLASETTGLELWKKCQAEHQRTPFMMLSGLTNEQYLNLVSKDRDFPVFLQKDLIPETLEFLWNTEFAFQEQKSENPRLQLLTVATLVTGFFAASAVMICSFVTL